ncbi:hypothetical protein [Shimia abyssi]|uniref:DUF2357 domain-containing protein n=1 Tax=Shimia abyssi TaxID=1662395 RepID=A0A2P8F2U9_9RHOB|nr:hypothetical protein [Shimia abyssi]PSL16039.1 hypothetical protein CLV88_1236 [Shimia abyssi]
MNLVRRPWSLRSEGVEEAVFGPEDCLLGDSFSQTDRKSRHTRLLSLGNRELRLFPYPKKGSADFPVQISGLPARPKIGLEPKTPEETIAVEVSGRMHRVLARIEELEGALDDPENLWERLQTAWDRAEDESNPRMAEIVRQAGHIKPHLLELEKRIRRVLRRNRELTPLDRVQEMDRASMLWMVRQPGRNTAERAGADQRVLAIVRHENFDTLENRVFHAYLKLASHFARQWIREHKQAQSSQRFRLVEDYYRLCRRLIRELKEMGVSVAPPGITANYVLMEDRAYRAVNEAWDRLLRQDKAEDELWAWQAESWTDFCILAVTLALFGLDEAKLISQAPLVWMDEAMQGRRFLHDRPLAVFWLRESDRIVEVQARPEKISKLQFAARANLWLRIIDLKTDAIPRRIPVWTPHSFNRMSPEIEATNAATLVQMLRNQPGQEILREGLILIPAHGVAESSEAISGGGRVLAISMDARGETLKEGKRVLASFVQTCIQGGEA